MKIYLVCLAIATSSIYLTMPTISTASPKSQVDVKAALDRSMRSNIGSNGKYQPLLASLKQWMGKYQKIQPEGTNYLAIFDRGSVPVTVKFKDNGSIDNYGMGCPIVIKSLSLSQAPPELQKLLSKCPNLK